MSALQLRHFALTSVLNSFTDFNVPELKLFNIIKKLISIAQNAKLPQKIIIQCKRNLFSQHFSYNNFGNRVTKAKYDFAEDFIVGNNDLFTKINFATNLFIGKKLFVLLLA